MARASEHRAPLQAPAQGAPRLCTGGGDPPPAHPHARGDDRGSGRARLRAHERQARDRAGGGFAQGLLRAVRQQGRLLHGDLRSDRQPNDQARHGGLPCQRGAPGGTPAGRIEGIRGRNRDQLQGTASGRDRRLTAGPDGLLRQRRALAASEQLVASSFASPPAGTELARPSGASDRGRTAPWHAHAPARPQQERRRRPVGPHRRDAALDDAVRRARRPAPAAASKLAAGALRRRCTAEARSPLPTIASACWRAS